MADTLEIFGATYTGVAGFKALDDNDQTKAYIRPQGTKSITANGTGIDVAEYATVDVNVSGGGSPVLQDKTVSYTPTESAQSNAVTADAGYDGLGEVTINVGAISSTYVGSGITRRSSSDLTVSGDTVSAPSGFYENSASKAVTSGTAGTPTATKGTVSNHAVTVTPSVTNTAGYISGGTISGTGVSVAASELVSGTLSITENGSGIDVTAVDVNISGGGIIVTETQDEHGGTVVEITSGTTVTLQSKSATPSESAQRITPDSGYNGMSEVNISAVSSTYVGSGITRRSSTDLTASGATVSVPAGYYESAASKSVASGSASTPATTITANPSISVSSSGLITATASASQSVTPTVSAGYVSSGTAGTVSVSGSNTSQLTTQAAQTIHPSTSDQTISSGRYLTGAQTIKAVTLANLTAANIKQGVTVTVGDSTDADCVASVTGTYSGGSSKNIQVYAGYASRTANSYGATSVTLTVAKTGTYTITWIAWRGSSSSTMGTNLHIGSTAETTNHTTWTGTYGQCITLSGQSLTQGQVLTLYATSGSNSRTIYVGNLIIQEE